MKKRAFITGTSSGLGLALSEELKDTHIVHKFNRFPSESDIYDISCDLSDEDSIKVALNKLPHRVKMTFDVVILNAGILGNLNTTNKLSLDEFKESMMVNCFSNKIIIDFFLKHFKVNNIIGISSGASESAYYGWSLYCCSKSAFRQMLGVYAKENTETSFYSVTAGPFKSKMQNYIIQQDENEIPSVKKFKESYSSMNTPESVAKLIINNLNTISDLPSGSYVDLRKRNS